MEYTSKKKESGSGKQREATEAAKTATHIPNSALESVMAGRARATSEMMGRRQDLAPSLNARMSKAFGMDLNGVQVYRSDAMNGTGTEGLASGNKIVLSSDVDLNTLSGQAVLGHELSHIHAQSQGIGLGNTGLYENAGLEHQADTEGMMAARGLSLNGETLGMDTTSGMQGFANATPMSSGMGLTAGAPMQAKKEKTEEDQPASKGKKFAGGLLGGMGRAFQGLGVGLNLLTGGHLFGSLYNKMKWKGAGILGKALLAPLTFATNLPSTLVGGMGHIMAKKAGKLWNSGWGKPESKGDEKLIYNNGEEAYEDPGFNPADLLISGGTTFSNLFMNPGADSKGRESWIPGVAKRNHNKITESFRKKAFDKKYGENEDAPDFNDADLEYEDAAAENDEIEAEDFDEALKKKKK